jgi:hypothetical protein
MSLREAADRLAHGTGERGRNCQMMCPKIAALGCGIETKDVAYINSHKSFRH